MKKHHQTIFAFTVLTIYAIAILALYLIVPIDKPITHKHIIEPSHVTHDRVLDPKPSPVIVEDREPHRVQISRGGSDVLTPMGEREIINTYVRDIAPRYNVKPELIMSIIEQESKYNPKARNGKCVGLMQVSTVWHAKRAAKLGVTNFYDPYSNILVGVDYIAELFTQYKDPRLVLMLYNMKHETALKMYKNGQVSSYAKIILARAEVYKKGV